MSDFITVIDFLVCNGQITHGNKSKQAYPTLAEAIAEADSWEETRCAVCRRNDFTLLYLHEGEELDDNIRYRRM